MSRAHKLEHSRVYVICHKKATCKGPNCPIHNRSNHHMRSWPQNWRDDRKIMERICPCGIGHPDPDEPRIISGEDNGDHGCCGHCIVSKLAV